METEQKELFKDCKYRIKEEGFHYCFKSYSSWDEIKDEEFHKLREAYLDSAKALEEYINEKARVEGEVVWRWDEDLWEGSIGGTHYFSIEPTKVGATIYQIKKPVGNFIDAQSVEKAKEYCELVLANNLPVNKNIKQSK